MAAFWLSNFPDNGFDFLIIMSPLHHPAGLRICIWSSLGTLGWEKPEFCCSLGFTRNKWGGKGMLPESVSTGLELLSLVCLCRRAFASGTKMSHISSIIKQHWVIVVLANKLSFTTVNYQDFHKHFRTCKAAEATSAFLNSSAKLFWAQNVKVFQTNLLKRNEWGCSGF